MEVELNEYVYLVFDDCGGKAVKYADIRDCKSNSTVGFMEFPSNYDFLTSFKCQAPVIENRLIDFYGEEKAFKIMTHIQNYLVVNFSSEV